MVALKKLRYVPVHFTVSTVIFTLSAAKTTVHTVKCTGTHLNFSRAIMNYPSAVFSVYILKIPTEFSVIFQSFCQNRNPDKDQDQDFTLNFHRQDRSTNRDRWQFLCAYFKFWDIQNMDIHQKKRFFFILAITIRSLFRYSVCDEKVKVLKKFIWILKN